MLRWLFSSYRDVPSLLNWNFCTLQDYSRSNNKDFSDLHFVTSIVTEESPEIAPGSILIPDLNIIGARWDAETNSLCDLHSDSPTINRQESLILKYTITHYTWSGCRQCWWVHVTRPLTQDCTPAPCSGPGREGGQVTWPWCCTSPSRGQSPPG